MLPPIYKGPVHTINTATALPKLQGRLVQPLVVTGATPIDTDDLLTLANVARLEPAWLSAGQAAVSAPASALGRI